MTQTTVYVAFANDEESNDRYLAVAATFDGAVAACVADQNTNMDTWVKIDTARIEHNMARDPKPVIDIIWDDDGNGTYTTTQDSTFTYPYDRGYTILTDTLHN